MSHPSGPHQINVNGATPGYLNAMGSQPDGGVSLAPPPTNANEFIGLAITVTDSAGPAHSLSALNDPALADVVNDLNHPPIGGGDFHFVGIYAYNAAPSQYADAQAILSSGEVANGGNPFDILLVANPSPSFQPPASWLTFSFGSEIGNLDGITALGVTDIGAVPEPGALGIAATSAICLVRRRPKH